MTFPTWPNVNYVVVSDEDYLLATEAQKVIDAALNPAPEVPPEVWQTERPDGERCMAATRAMCAGQ